MLGNMSRLGKSGAAKKSVHELIAAADAYRDQCAWIDAAKSYQAALEIDPTLFHIWVQYGHALKGSGRLNDAEDAYRRALAGKDEADTHLQLGHLLKIADRKAEALESYKKALRITPNDPAIKREIEVCEQGLGKKFHQGSGTYQIYFDISDLLFYIGHHDNLTGIQRVQASIVLALLDIDLTDVTVHFLTYVNSRASFYEIDQSFIISLLYDLSLKADARQVQFDKIAARDGYMRESVPLKALASGKNMLCLLGAAWVNRDYFLRVRNLKQSAGFRVMFLIHDLIPIFARETCDQGTAEVFTNFLIQSYHVTDGYFCVSQSTRNDLIRYFSRLGWNISDPVVTQNGTLLPARSEPSALESIDFDLAPGNYVLFVSTIEGRKNHIAAFKAFEKLLGERSDVPYLVCVGRLGWRAEEFLYSCEASEFLHGKIKILTDVPDNELTALYQNCLLTIYPSLYEGWGLPVGEALGFGKVCITSNVSSLPEAGGDFAQYIDPLQPVKLAETIAFYLDDPGALEKAEAHIRTHYRPIEWKDAASKIVRACLANFEKPIKSPLPTIELGREYPVSTMAKLPLHLMGGRMVEAISQARTRVLTSGLYSEADYISGQNVRMGNGWCEPEANFTWARIKDAEVAFSLSDSNENPLAIYIAYEVTDPCIGAILHIESPRGQTISCEITRLKSHIVVHGLKPVNSTGQKHYVIRLKIKGSDNLEDRLRALDGRCPALAIRSFVVISEADIAARLTILERMSFLGTR